MTATFNWVEYLTTETSTATPTNLNLGNTTEANLSPSLSPITAGTYSYEKWVRGLWTGSFTRIENLKVWLSDSGPMVTGERINYTGIGTTYQTPTNGLDKASVSIPTSEPGSANVGITGTTTASLTSTGYSDYIVLQASVTSAASAGSTNQKTFTLQFDEV